MNWVGRTAIEIAEAVRTGRVDAAEVLEQHLAQIDRVDGRVGAFEVVDHAGARAAAAAVDRDPGRDRLALAGVPVGIKDVVDVAGLPTRYGSAGSPDRPAPADDELVARLRAVGAVVVGKTRGPELSLAAVSDNAFGVARNPWNLTRIPAGSSGGSAAALASAQVPIALGSDGGGSIRLPSAACGTVGIKPGEGTVPHRSDDPAAHWHGMSQYGPMATTVADVAVMLDVLAQTDRFAAGVDADPPPLRIACSDLPNVPLPRPLIDRDIRRAWRRTAATLAAHGHHVADVDPEYPSYLARAIATRSFNGARHDADMIGIDETRIGPRARTVLRLDRVAQRLAPVRDEDAVQWKAQADAFFADHDVLVTPATGRTPFRHRGWHDRGLVAMLPSSLRFAAFTSPWNLADLPAAVVPAGISTAGLPVAVQIVAGRGREDVVLRVAALLERRHPWPRHAPDWRAGQPLPDDVNA